MFGRRRDRKIRSLRPLLLVSKPPISIGVIRTMDSSRPDRGLVVFRVGSRLLRRKSPRASGSTRFISLWVGRRPMRNSSIATIGLRPPPDDVGRQKGCKVRIARDSPDNDVANTWFTI